MASLVALAITATAPACSRSPATPAIQAVGNFAQGTTYEVQWWSQEPFDAAELAEAARQELERIDRLLSNYREDSVIERFNASRTLEVQPLTTEIVRLLDIAADVHRRSEGCFDPTVRPLVRLWRLDGGEPAVPSAEAIELARGSVGFEKIEIVSESAVRKTVADVEIDFASIGQGYAAQRLAIVAENLGLQNYLIEIGGELVARGRKPNGEPWRIGIERPDGSGVQRILQLQGDKPAAVTTSGTYRRSFAAQGRTFSHILDPGTGWPVQHALLGVTVVHSDAAVAGAWGTALVCLGPDRALATADREGIAAILQFRTANGIEERHSAPLARDWPNVAVD
jgi:thiamine biosynthesis lipoprotein